MIVISNALARRAARCLEDFAKAGADLSIEQRDNPPLQKEDFQEWRDAKALRKNIREERNWNRNSTLRRSDVEEMDP